MADYINREPPLSFVFVALKNFMCISFWIELQAGVQCWRHGKTPASLGRSGGISALYVQRVHIFSPSS